MIVVQCGGLLPDKDGYIITGSESKQYPTRPPFDLMMANQMPKTNPLVEVENDNQLLLVPSTWLSAV